MLGITGASAAADDKEHLTVMNDLAGASIGALAISVIRRRDRTSSRTLDGRGYMH